MPIIRDSDDLEELLSYAATPGEASPARSLAHLAQQTSEKITQPHQGLSEFAKIYGDLDPTTVFRTLKHLVEAACPQKASIAIFDGGYLTPGLVNQRHRQSMWLIFSIKNPVLVGVLDAMGDQFALLCEKLGLKRADILSGKKPYIDLSKYQADFRMKTAFSMTTFSPEWTIRLETLRSVTESSVELRARLEKELQDTDPLFEDFARDIRHCVDEYVGFLHRTMAKLQLAEETAQEVVGVLQVPPPLAYTEHKPSVCWDETPSYHPPEYWRVAPSYPGDIYLPEKPPFRRSLSHFLGEQLCVYLITVTLCLAGLGLIVFSIYQTENPTSLPVIDADFFAVLSSSSVSFAAVYCIIIPLLRGDTNPVKRVWVFYSWLVLGTIAAVAAAGVYPVSKRTCLALAYFSAVAQLAATLQWIQGSSKKIMKMEVELDKIKAQR